MNVIWPYFFFFSEYQLFTSQTRFIYKGKGKTRTHTHTHDTGRTIMELCIIEKIEKHTCLFLSYALCGC